jgi:hypothetical protein
LDALEEKAFRKKRGCRMVQETRDFSWETDGEEPVPLGLEPVEVEEQARPNTEIDLRDPPSVATPSINGHQVDFLPGRPPGKNGAGEFTEEFMLRPKSLRPASGWRRGLY